MSNRGRLQSPELTERDAKFYNGTYKWNSEGFEDEKGVYHSFTQEPPPAPFPYSKRARAVSSIDLLPSGVIQVNHGPLVPNYQYGQLGQHPHVPHPSFNPMLTRALVEPSADLLTSYPVATPTGFGTAYRMTIPSGNLFSDRSEPIRERLRGRVEGILIGQWYAGVGISLEEAYNLVGIEYPDDVVKNALEILESRNRFPPQGMPDGKAKAPTRDQSPKVSPFKINSPKTKSPKIKLENDTSPPPTIPSIFHAPHDSPRTRAEFAKSGLREKVSTPVNAPETSLSQPTLPTSLDNRTNQRGRKRKLGEGEGSDSDSGDEKGRKKNGGHYDEGKEKPKKKKDEDSEDSEEDGGNGGAAGKDKDAAKRKDSTLPSSAVGSRRSSRKAEKKEETKS